jgi:hypothetical protein
MRVKKKITFFQQNGYVFIHIPISPLDKVSFKFSNGTGPFDLHDTSSIKLHLFLKL